MFNNANISLDSGSDHSIKFSVGLNNDNNSHITMQDHTGSLGEHVRIATIPD